MITFEYVKGGAVTPPTEGNQAVRVEYKATKAGTLIGTETVNVPLDAAGFGTLTADLLKSVPAGYKASNVGTTDSELGNEVMKSSTPVKMLVIVEALPATAITGIAMSDATKTVWTGWGTAVNATTLKNAGITFDVTYANGTRKGVAADDTTTLGTTTIVAGTATDWKVDGALKVTVNTDKACTVPVKISATLNTDVVEGDNLSTDWTITAEASKTTKDASVVLTFTHKTTEIDFDEDAAKALVAKLLDDSTGNGIALSFAFKELTTEGVASGTAAQAKFTVTATITRTGAPSAAAVDLKVKASA